MTGLFWLSPWTQNVGNFKVAAVAPATQSRRNNIQLDCYWLLEQRDPRAASDYTTEYTTRFWLYYSIQLYSTIQAARSAEFFSNRGPLVSSRNCSRSDPETVENRSPLVEV